jgi:hypothetical protein
MGGDSVSDLIIARRQAPGGNVREYRLTGTPGDFRLVTAEAERVIGAGDLVSALADATEFTSFGASDHLSFTCADDATRASLVAALVDEAPESEFDDELWPDDTNVPPDEFPAPSVLRRRWIDIDGDVYHPLALTDRTRLVRYDDPDIDGGELLFTASWADSLALVGGDVRLEQRRGEIWEVSIEIVDSVALTDRIASWVAGNLHGPATILHLVGAPGLESAAHSSSTTSSRKRWGRGST